MCVSVPYVPLDQSESHTVFSRNVPQPVPFSYLAVEVDASIIWIECDRVTLSTVTVLTKEWSSVSTMLTGII